MKRVMVRDRQRRRGSRISGVMRGQFKAALISGGFGIFLSMQGQGWEDSLGGHSGQRCHYSNGWVQMMAGTR